MASLRLVFVVFLAALMLAAVPNASAIVGGTPDPNRDYVVFVGQQVQLGGGPNWINANACSGTLVAPTVVVTAAHCSIVPPLPPTAPPVTAIRYVVFQADVVTPTTPFVTGEFVAHPDFCFGGTCAGGPEGFTNNDLAVVLLDSPLAGPYATLPKPKSVERAFSSLAPATYVGYGLPALRLRQSASDQAIVDSSAENFLLFPLGAPPTPCRGDSGGPVLVDSTVVAVLSVGDNSCAGRTFAYRLDIPSAFSFLNKYVHGAPSSSDKWNR